LDHDDEIEYFHASVCRHGSCVPVGDELGREQQRGGYSQASPASKVQRVYWALEAGFKNFLPGLDYVLVDEKMRDAGRNTLIFRGQGDTKVVIKLRTFGIFTKISIRIGLTGNQSKSAQLFSYVYRRM
jgi:hypothetical protein